MESAINKTGKTAATPSRRIALLLSGGVDSAVVLHLLCEQGIKPDCFYIKIGPEDTPEENWIALLKKILKWPLLSAIVMDAVWRL